MNSAYTHVPNLSAQEIPPDGILSRTLYNDDQVKVVLFAFSAGQELSEHTASMPAILQVLKGQAQMTLGDDVHQADVGFWVYMPAQLRHRIQAKTPLILLLQLLKGQPGAAAH
jgi:quercetin dioxygenase-like cupin family protein